MGCEHHSMTSRRRRRPHGRLRRLGHAGQLRVADRGAPRVRRDAGMFDVSHMCVVDLRARACADYLRRLLATTWPAHAERQGALLVHAARARRSDRRPDRLLPGRPVVPHGRERRHRATRTSSGCARTPAASGDGRARFDLAIDRGAGPNARSGAAPCSNPNSAAPGPRIGNFFGRRARPWFRRCAPATRARTAGRSCCRPTARPSPGLRPARGRGAALRPRRARHAAARGRMNSTANDMDESVSRSSRPSAGTIAWDPQDRDFIVAARSPAEGAWRARNPPSA